MSGGAGNGGTSGGEAPITRAGTAERWISAQAVTSNSQTNSPRHSNASESPRAAATSWSGNVPSGPSASFNFGPMLDSGYVPSVSGPFAASGSYPTHPGAAPGSGYPPSTLVYSRSSPGNLGLHGSQSLDSSADQSSSLYPPNGNVGNESSPLRGSFPTPLKAPDRWEECSCGGPYGFSVQSCGWRHEDSEAHHSAHEV
jgi:hypothetical protein